MTREVGTVTAELAVGLIGVVFVLAFVLSVASLGRQQLGVLDAAAAGARSAARGEPVAEVKRVAARLAGPEAEVRVTGDGNLVTVVVSRPARLALPGTPHVTVAGRATFPAEPQVLEP